MRKLLALLGFIIFLANVSYSQEVIVNYQKQYCKQATETEDTISTAKWNYFKFSVAPTETDSVIYWSFSDFSAGDSMKIVYPQVWNQPDWLDAKIFDKLIFKGASEYLLNIWGRKRP